MKKHFLLIVVLFLFTMVPITVNAAYGDIRYQVTSLNLSGTKITFKGWAFVHRINNTGLPITITAYKNGSTIEEKSKNGSGYNFNKEMCYKSGSNCIDPAFKCNQDEESQTDCKYQNIGFDITFDTKNWNLKEGDRVNFTISINGFSEPIGITSYAAGTHDNGNIAIDEGTISKTLKFIAGEGRFSQVGGGLYTETKNGITRNVIGSTGEEYELESATSSSQSSSGYYVVKTEVSTKEVNLRNSNEVGFAAGPCSSGNCTSRKAPAAWLKPTTQLYITIGNGEEKCSEGDKADTLGCNSSNGFSNDCSDYYQTKKLKLLKTSMGNISDSQGGNEACSITASDHKFNAQAKVTVEQYSGTASVTDPEETYAGGNITSGISFSNSIRWHYYNFNYLDRNNLNYEHKYIISGFWTERKSTPIYDEDGNVIDYEIEYERHTIPSGTITKICGYNDSNQRTFKYGRCDILVPECKTDYGKDAKETVETAMKNSIDKNYNGKIKSELSNLTLNEENVASSVTCSEKNPEFKPESKEEYKNEKYTLKTTCQVSLSSNSFENYTGKITSAGSGGYSLNNKYYTNDLTPNSYQLALKLENLNRIVKGNQAGIPSATWSSSFDCPVNTYALLESSNDGVIRYNFIYRPIELKDPFPDRNPGLNWIDWYPSNKKRLESTYSNLEYRVSLDNQKVLNIKEYNKNHNYISWDGIDNSGNSSFIDKYFTGSGDVK